MERHKTQKNLYLSIELVETMEEQSYGKQSQLVERLLRKHYEMKEI